MPPHLSCTMSKDVDDIDIKICDFGISKQLINMRGTKTLIGTPYCITVDHQTVTDNTVTIRERDSMNQERIHIDKLEEFLRSSLNINNWLLNND